MKPKLIRLQEVFLKAVQELTEGGRAVVLDRECDGDAELHFLAAKLLHKHDLKYHALDTPAVDLLPTRSSAETDTVIEDEDVVPNGTIIAERYRITSLLGHGGMGAVYCAEQIIPFRRTVAIKLIRPGLANKSMLTRFDSERQVLARMNHTNIAKVFDAGTDGGGPLESRPYFVMEFVEGVPINQYCKQEHLSLRKRLELFIPVCQAIEHAHQKGVIHRDLKPGNILVTKRDGQAVPVVIDFGIAKCIEKPFDANTSHTSWGLFLGTFDYMAPEQALGQSADVDTGSDVYSLGAVLYELLCGFVPLERDPSRDASVFELASQLKENEPKPPSARLRGKKNKSAHLRGELDWIVLKCLDKDRDRRYSSARALADDLTRYLAAEPVAAGPPSAGYRLRKFVRRNLAGVVAACCVLIALVGGIAGTTYGMFAAWKAEAVAVKALDEKEKARAAEEQERVRANAKAAQAKFISDFIQFDVLRQANPVAQFNDGFTPNSNLTVKQALDRSAATIENRFRDKPLVMAALFHTIGQTYDGLGEYPSALKNLRRSYEIFEQTWGPQDERVISSRHSLARCLDHDKKSSEAVPLFEKNVEILHSLFGSEHNKVLNAETDLANALRDLNRLDEAERLLTHVYETVRVSAPHSDNMIHTMINLAGINECRGQIDEAIRKLESLQDQLPRGVELHPRTKFTIDMGLGRYYLDANRFSEGIQLIESACESALRLFGEEHFEHLNAISVLSDAYLTGGRANDGLVLLEQTHKRLKTKLPLYDARIYRVGLELAQMAMMTGDLPRAESIAQETDKASTQSKNGDSFIRGLALCIQGRSLFLNGQSSAAEPIVREGLGIMTAQLKDDAQTHAARILLGQILLSLGRYSEAESELSAGYHELKKLSHRLLFSLRLAIPDALDALALCADAQNRPTDAERFRSARRLLEK